MSAAMGNSEFQAHTEEIERLVQRVTALTDDDARTAALELLQSLMDLHGAVMCRVVEVLSQSGEAGSKSLARLSDDPLICGLLVLYGVHPVPLEERITKAIEKVRPQLRKQGGGVELLGIADTTVRVKIDSSGHGCGSSPDAFKSAVEEAVLEAAPEIIEIITEGLPVAAQGFVPVNKIQPATRQETTKEGKKYEESAA
jgi:Fe-S cluster biogenesis protein NfuA